MSEEVNELRRHPPWREGIKRFLEAAFPYETVVPHRWFYQAFGLEYPDKEAISGLSWERLQLKFLRQFSFFWDVLLKEHSIHLESVPGEGYRVLPPPLQTKVAFEEGMKDVAKAMRKMADRLQHTEFDKLTVYEQQQNIHAQNQVGMLAASFKLTRKMPKLADKKPPQLENGAP